VTLARFSPGGRITSINNRDLVWTLAQPNTAMLRILIIDDHEVVREGVKGVFTADIAEFGEARSGAEALDLVRAHDVPSWVLHISFASQPIQSC